MGRTRELPDLNYIRRDIPIFDVAKGLGIKLAGKNTARCWRDAHQNGDRTPSISFHKNCAKCHVCDVGLLSTVDLVMMHENCDFAQAVRWITARWDVPALPPNTKLRRPQRWSAGRIGVAHFPVENMVRTGLWAWLSDAARALLITLACFTDPVTGEAVISQRGLARYCGKASRTTIAAVIAQFEQIGLLKVTRAKRDDAVRPVSTYKLTIESERFQGLLAELHERLIRDRDVEKLQVKTARQTRRDYLRSKTLHTTVDRSQSLRATTVDRSDKNVPKMQTKRSSTVYRSLGDDLEYPVTWDGILRDPRGEPGELADFPSSIPPSNGRRNTQIGAAGASGGAA
jgi:hypothetical protein